MRLYPSIDIRDGKVVRLLRGDYDAQTTYDEDAVAAARRFADAGAEWIHVVDLDAARHGGNANLAIVAAICGAVDVQVQTGGGVRSLEEAMARFAAGVTRVVIGSAAVERPELVDELIATHPGRIAVGLDARDRDVATHGWTNATGADLITMAQRFDRGGVGALVVTSIGVDGTLAGPDLDQLAAVVEAVDVPVIASGGVGTLDDVIALRALPLEGVIVGRALYEGRFTAEEAVAACSASE